MECTMCHGKKVCPACNGRGRVNKGPESIETQKCHACDGNKIRRLLKLNHQVN